MAANLKGGRVLATTLGKLINIGDKATLASSQQLKRKFHVSSYDKNIEEHVRPSVVPDYVIDDTSSNYWGPHPITGVFGPAGSDTGRAQIKSDAPSVLDQTAWFRPLELADVEKSHH